MDFSLIDYLDEDACSTQLVELLHPDGRACPRCGERERLGIHRCRRAPLVDLQCGDCGRVFNAFTGTSLQGTHRRPAQLLMILRGVAQGTPTAPMARESGGDRKELLTLRHRLQEHARVSLDRNPLDDDVVEADEMDRNAGERRDPAR
jgi:transposase-like protein